MTQNQLKWWELQWKKMYEKLYLEETARANKAKEKETSRHNRAEERIATQQLVLERQKLGQSWAKLNADIRAAMVREVIDYENAKTNRYNAQINAYKANTEAYKAQTDRIKVVNQLAIDMVNQEVVVAQLWLNGVEAKTKSQLEFFKQSINLAEDTFDFKFEGNIDPDLLFGDNNFKITAETDLGKLILNIMNLGKDYGNEAEYNEVIEKIRKIAPAQIEMYGPVAGKVDVPDLPNLNQYPQLPSHESMGQQSNSPVDTNGDAKLQDSQIQNRSIGGVTSVQPSNSGPTKNVVETKTSGGTKVIYSGGSKYGPGYNN